MKILQPQAEIARKGVIDGLAYGKTNRCAAVKSKEGLNLGRSAEKRLREL
jgi:hypothetical protein